MCAIVSHQFPANGYDGATRKKNSDAQKIHFISRPCFLPKIFLVHPGSALLWEIREGAERLANELDEYLSRGSDKTFTPDKDGPPLSDEAVANLQLETARKLREVSVVAGYWYRSSHGETRNRPIRSFQ